MKAVFDSKDDIHYWFWPDQWICLNSINNHSSVAQTLTVRFGHSLRTRCSLFLYLKTIFYYNIFLYHWSPFQNCIQNWILSNWSPYVAFWRHKLDSWLLWWKFRILYCWIFMCYLIHFQNGIKHICSYSPCSASECDRQTNSQTKQLTNDR